MAKLTGIFENFFDLENLSLEKIDYIPKSINEIKRLENSLGNRVLYPQTIAMDASDLNFDYVLLLQGLKSAPQVVYNQWAKKINITDELEGRFPDLTKLITVITEAVNPSGVIAILKKMPKGFEQLGTVITPEKLPTTDTLDVDVGNQKYQLNKGDVTVLPINARNVIVRIGESTVLNVNGGKIGVVFNLLVRNA